MTTKSKQDKHKMSEIDENISKMFDIKKVKEDHKLANYFTNYPLNRLGKGAYGIVWKALDKRNNETIAVKKIFDAFRDETDAQRTFREIIFLKAFRSHPNVVNLHNVYRATNNLDIYLIFEYMESDLHNIIKKGTILKDIHKRYVMYQLMNAVKYIHSGNVIHRDLKPSNVLIDSKCRCKLADFGLARSVAAPPIRHGLNNDMDGEMPSEPLLTDYVATRWYRAPEILVASKRYTKGIDMWSLGCILGEMIRGKPLFQGSSTVNQIEKIISTLPDVTEHDVKAVGAGFGSVLLNKTIPKEKKITLNELLIEASKDALDLVKSLLVLDPMGRLTANQALRHPYLEKFRNSVPEKELHFDVLPPFRDDVRLTVPEYRSKLYEILDMTEGGEKRNSDVQIKKGLKTSAHTKYRERIHEKPDDKIPVKSKSNTDCSTAEDKYTTAAINECSQNVHNVVRCQTKITPLSKRKQIYNSNDSNIKISDADNLKSDQIISLHDGKVHCCKSNGNRQITMEKRSLPHVKRHSITNTEDSAVSQTLGSSNKRLNSSHRLCRSSISLAPAENNLQFKPMQPHKSLANDISLKSCNPQQDLRSTKSDLHCLASSDKTTLSKDRICYEKRLKKLEEEIERYKNEVKTFCRETFIYSKQKNLVDANQSIHNKATCQTIFPTNTPIKATYFHLLTKGNQLDSNKSDFDLSSGNSGSSDHFVHADSNHSSSGRSQDTANRDSHSQTHLQRPHQHHQCADHHRQRRLTRPLSKFS